MEDTCVICKKFLDVYCSCENSLGFCYKDCVLYQKERKEDNEFNDLPKIKQELHQLFKSFIEKANKAKKEILNKSNSFIHNIQLITKTKLLFIDKNIEICETALKISEVNEKSLEPHQTRENDIKSWTESANKHFLSFKADVEILETNSEADKFLTEVKSRKKKYFEQIQQKSELEAKVFKKIEENKLTQDSELNVYLEDHRETLRTVVFTSDNKYLVSSYNECSIIVWNLIEKRQDCVLQGHTSSIKCIKVTNDNKHIISASGHDGDNSENAIRIWNLLEKRQEFVLQGHNSPIWSLAVTSDNKYIISGSGGYTVNSDNSIRIWNFPEKRQETLLNGHNDLVRALAITKDNKFIISGSYDFTVTVWSIQEKKKDTVFQGHKDIVVSVAVTHDNNFVVSGSYDCTVIVWNFVSKTQHAVFLGHASCVKSVGVTQDDKFIVSGSGNLYDGNKDFSLRVWNLLEKRLEGFLSFEDEVCAVDVDLNNLILVSFTNGKTCVISLKNI